MAVRRIVRAGSLVTAGVVFSTVVGIPISVILARQLGPSDYGLYTFVIAGAGLLATIARLGLGTIVVRDSVSNDEVEAPRNERGGEPVLIALVLATAISLALGTLAISPPGLAIFARIGELETQDVTLLVALSTSMALYMLLVDAFRGYHEFLKASFLGAPVQRAILLVLLLLFLGRLSPRVALMLTVTAATASLLLAGAVMAQQLRTRSFSGPRRGELAATLFQGAPIAATEVARFASTRLPIWTLGFLGLLEGAGVFALALTFSVLVGLFHSIALTTLGPFVAESIRANDLDKMQSRVRLTAAASTVATVGSGVGLILCGFTLTSAVFGDGFRSAVPVMGILLLGTVANAYTGQSGLVLNLSGNQRWATLASAIAFSLIALLVIPASIVGGAYGAALALAGAVIVQNSLTVIFARKVVGVNTVADFSALVRYVVARRYLNR